MTLSPLTTVTAWELWHSLVRQACRIFRIKNSETTVTVPHKQLVLNFCCSSRAQVSAGLIEPSTYARLCLKLQLLALLVEH